MTNFGDNGDLSIGTNTFAAAHPGIFTFQIVETPPTGTDRGHIDLIVQATILKWTGAGDSNWFIGAGPNTPNWKDNVNAPRNYIDLVATVFNDTDATGTHNVVVTEAAGVSPASIL